MKILQVENIRKSFDGRRIIEDINLHIRKGELVSLLGVSGVGKTTLFNIIAGVTRPDKGRILFEGQDITGQSGSISYMLQKDLLLEHKTIIDNVSLPLVIRGQGKKAAREEASRHFGHFGIAGSEYKYPRQLSGGMRQRAALLRTYLFSDHFALLDEPFSALDTITKGEMHRWYLGIMEEIKLSTIFITHDIDEAILLSDRIYIMTGRPGRINYEIKISEAKPRQRDFLLTDEFLAYKREIIDILDREKARQ